MEILLPILFLLVLVLWLRSKKMTPEDKLPQCEVILTAPVVAPRTQALNYQLALSLGPVSELWETWVTASGGGGPYGEGRVPGQVPAVSLGNGVYTQDISTLPPGDYLLWARCIDRNSACLGAWTAHVLQVTTGSGAVAPTITTNNGAPIALMTTAGSTVSQVFVATGNPTLTWSLSGPNAGLFTVTPATGPIVTVQTPSGLPAGSYSVTVGVSNGQGAASSSLSAVASSNSAAPQNTTAPAISGGAVVSGLFSNTAGTWSGIPTPSVLREWVRGDSDTGPWTVMSLATAGVSFAAPASSLGKYVAVRETGSNGVGAPVVVLSNRLGPVTAANAAPALSSVPSIYGSALEGSSLGYGEGGWVGNPLPSVTRQLQRSPNGVDGWTTVQAAVPGSAFYTITNASNAQYLSVLETASNGVGAPAVYRTNVIGPVTQSGSPPVNATLPTISGSAQVAQATDYVGGTWNGVPVPTVSRQWQSSANGLDNWETVAAANPGTPRTVAAGDASRYVSVLETASNGVGSPVSRRSNVIGPMQAVQPTNTVPAAITGAAEVGAGTTYVRGAWAGIPAPVVTSVWQRGTPVGNIWETIGPAVPGTSYTKVAADNGKHIQVWEVATNSAGSASQASNVLGPVVDPTVGPPTLTTLGGLAWNPTVGLTSTYDPATEVWANATSVERRWVIDGHEILDADMPWLHIPRDAWGAPGLRLRATGPGGSAVHNVTHSTIVGQPYGLSPSVRQGGTSGLTPGPFPNGSAPVPLSGGTTFVTVEGMSITATGALHTTGTDDYPYGWATLELGALPNGRHKAKFTNLSRSIRQEFAFCLSEGWGGHLGSARGYMIRVFRPDWVMSTPMKVELLKLNGAGAAAVVMADYGNLGTTVAEYEVDLTITPTSLAFTLTPDVGAAISGSSTDIAYRGSRLQIGDVVGTGAGAKTLITLQAAHYSAVAIPQADRYQLTWADEFNDTDRSRFTDVGTPQAGKKVWRTRFSWTEDINGESQTYGGNLFELANGQLTIVAQRTSAPGQPQRWSSDVVTTEKTFGEQYGYFEFRFKAPKGQGFWIALWLMGIEDTWPGGEIDIVEHDGSFPTRFSHALHHANPATGADVATGSFPTIPYEREVDEWNVVSGEWNPDGTIQFRVNHSPTWLASHTMHRPMYVLMNLALAPTPEAVPGFWIVGPDASTPSPGRFAIDYVRCWQRPSHKANLPVISTPPMMSRAGNVLTITPGVSNAASVRGVLRTGTAGGAMEIASTVTNRANGNAVATFTYTLSSGTPNGKVNWYEEHTSSSGGKIQTASPWTWWESGGSDPQVCQLLITAPDTIANDQTLSYSLALVDGTCDTWQTWLLTASGTGGTTGDGAFIGQTDSVGGGVAGSYIKNISNLPPGNYKIWGKCNSASSSCNQSWAVKNITITAGTTPPPPAPPPSGAVPTAILNLPSAPMPTSSQFTTKAAQGWSENWQTGSDGDWGSLKRRGFYLCQNGCWQVGSGLYNLQFVADPNASLSGTQFHQRVGLGTMTSAGTVSCQMRVRLPSHSVIQSVRGGGVISEVVTYPELEAGQILGIGHYQQQKIPNCPIQFKDIRSFWLGAKAWNSTVTGDGWIAHDMRACNTSAHDDTYAEAVAAVDCEILITHRHFPANRNLSPGATSGTYCGEFNLGGNLYRVYIQQGATRYSNGQYAGLIQFRTVNGLPNHVDVYPLVEFMLTKTYAQLGHYGARARGQGLNDTLINPNMWWVQSVTGMETEFGAYDLDIDSYYCRINQDI